VKKQFGIILILILFLGCASYPNLQPIYPKTGKHVSSVRPTFKWLPVNNKDVKYDLIIWEYIKAPVKESIFNPRGSTVIKEYLKGEVVFSVKEIDATEYTLPFDLDIDTSYYWSIRVSGTKNWSKVNYVGATNINFRFQTP